MQLLMKAILDPSKMDEKHGNDEGSCESVKRNSKNFVDLVGNTPLVSIQKLIKPHLFTCQIYAKCEFRNPSGSAWDRFVVHKLHEEDLCTGNAIATGGNGDLCLSLSWAGAVGRFPVTVLPGSSADEVKLELCRSFGANVVLSYAQDTTAKTQIKQCLEKHIGELNGASGIDHFVLLPFPTTELTKLHYYSTSKEVLDQLNAKNKSRSNLDMIVCGGDDKGLLYTLGEMFHERNPKLIAVSLKDNTFIDTMEDNDKDGYWENIKWVNVSDAEAYDMTRRLIREEGLTVGPVSGAVMSAALKAAFEHGLHDNPDAKILVVLPDSLANSSREFLSTEWMIRKNYYNPLHLESLYWWYDMALENISPPVVLIVPPTIPAKRLLQTMNENSTKRAVLAEGEKLVGIVTLEMLNTLTDSPQENTLVETICHRTFALIDSTATFCDLENLLQKFHWVIRVHRVTYYSGENESKMKEDPIGVINLADFINYKRAVEAHHFSEYGMAMSDGIPSLLWVENFAEFANESNNKTNEAAAELK
ncbi:unnamed protein product [Orchesella dallaii]|uniref:Cystathionine beta-synthase n=1 Tax=Orchesella dallaii TaxID=48710 RepID=A0ABP1S6T6_9HEXA